MNVEQLGGFLETHAIALPDPLDGATVDLSLLEPLAKRIHGYDFVALGELNHFVHEKSDFRLLLSRCLLSLGWTDFAEELGWSDGLRVDRYMRSADESEIDRLPSFGYTAHLRSDRNDRPGGILKSGAYPTEAFLWEQKRFYRGLRQAASLGGVEARMAGIDIDGLPGGGYEDVAGLLPAGTTSANSILRMLRRVPGESAPEEAARLRCVLGALPSGLPDELAEALYALSESLDYIALTYSAATYDEVRPGMAFRENAMKRRLSAAARLLDSPRMVVMAHALHLAKDDRKIKSSGVGPGGGRTPSLGHWLVQERKRSVFSIWMLYGGGEDSQPLASLPRRADFPRHSLNRLLSASGRPLLFFPADAPQIFGQSCVIGHMYNALIETPLLEQADAVIFLPQVTPLRCA